ncbi:thioredoxin-related transmembrane protein 1 isoform X2 [Sciurus carolinensis]|uniref:thioredoxin-related transmembrane protein 1 isoform X2 n=1 Tax=Sciurus carolinensis TaxID=30640 RepID=UPI001FB1B02A|nr:thioredoxin-related transmembrane protein 1 isoform X2 [Sciurus carolinensis]
MAPLGRLVVLLTVLVLLLWGVRRTHGRRSDVRVITDENWRELLEGEWMIEFYAPWCPACQNLQPEWESFAEWGEDLEVNVAKVDVTEQTGLSGRFIITALPTIYQMSSMSALFRLSMNIRTCHNYFIEDLGLPVWGSYTLFALATLLSGLLLGLCMIFVADCLCPSKRRKPQPYPLKKSLPEFSQPLKKVEEEQEADEEDVSEEEAESKEGTNKDFSQNAIRQRSVGPSLSTDKS